MNQGFIADKDGRIKMSWVWTANNECPFPDRLQLDEGDTAYNADETPPELYLAFHVDIAKHKMPAE